MINLSQVREEHTWGVYFPLDQHTDYRYARFEIGAGQEGDIRPHVERFGALYVVSGLGRVSCKGLSSVLNAGGSEFFAFRRLDEIRISTEGGMILQGISVDDDPEVLREGYRVDKSTAWGPGGEELWLQWTARNCFKRIVLPAGRITSLQYHRQKYETNFIQEGRARIYRGPLIERASPEETLTATKGGLEIVEGGPGDFFPVPVGLVHRVEALTDLVLLEASTTHVDDVVRLEDATGRGDGRIASEHKI